VRGIFLLPFSTLRVSFPVLSNPRNNHRAAPLTLDQFQYAFTNTLSEEESEQAYNRYAVPGPDHVLFQAAFANFNPQSASAVNFENATRAPLLLTAGSADHVSPPSVVKANFQLYRNSPAITEYKEYPGRTHYTLAQDGWEDVADDALDWAIRNSALAKNEILQPL
jgi:alpha-beta hydrolase superfamily lysophospholipase